jgi:SAM-dependent methyltransferase
MSEYRWNQRDVAEQYDLAAPLIHPHYGEIQHVVLDALPPDESSRTRLVDLGGGSGRLVELFLYRWPSATAVVLDQSDAFLALAEVRLRQFGARARVLQARLEDDWTGEVSPPVNAFVSMSAIHHLDSEHKQALFRRIHGTLAPGDVFVNGDECRAPDDETYLADVQYWAGHMNDLIANEHVSGAMVETLKGWQARNVGDFGGPRANGDDCHETVDVQLAYLRAAGFSRAECVWQDQLWAVIRAIK